MDFIDTPWPVRHASDPSDDIDLKDFIDNLGDDGDGFLDNTGARLEASAGASVAQGSPRSIFGMRASSLEELMAEAGRIAPPGGVNGAGARAAADLERVARAAGLHGLCDALAFTGLAAELPALCEAGVTVLAPSDAAWAQLEPRSRADPVLIRQVLLAHICSGVHMRSDLVAKRTAVALAGQTHAAALEGGEMHVGTARVLRADLPFDSGVIHELGSVMAVLHFAREAHEEQVWKKSLQPAPRLVVVTAAGAATTSDYELHGCLLHAATGQLLPDALRGHVRSLQPRLHQSQVQQVTFSDLCVMTKPPSLQRRRGAGLDDGANRYRLLFSLWNSSTLSYVSWQHMPTPLLIRNSFHMLPPEEKAWRHFLDTS